MYNLSPHEPIDTTHFLLLIDTSVPKGVMYNVTTTPSKPFVKYTDDDCDIVTVEPTYPSSAYAPAVT